MTDYYTPLNEIKPKYDSIVKTFFSGVTRDLEWRESQLLQLGLMLQDHEQRFVDALEKDMGKSPTETLINEVDIVKGEIQEALSKLKSWAKPTRVSTSWSWMITRPVIYHEPKGVALIIGTWNFPISLALSPLVGAIAAGCPAILKPAEHNVNLCVLWQELIPQYLDPNAYCLVNGSIDEVTELLKYRYDHIFYTGNGTVAKIIGKVAAENLTSITLELGGKSPAIVFDDCDLLVSARRIMWGKFTNAGQICIAPDYVMTTPAMAPKLIRAMEQVLEEFTNKTLSTSDNPDFCRIISQSHFKRLLDLLERTKGTVAFGGKSNVETQKIDLTVVKDVKIDDALMEGEIFGPILPILTFETKEEMAQYIRSKEIPLSLYLFTSSNETREFIRLNTRSGSLCQNDTLVQNVVFGVPFGGSGHSGLGNYHGKYSFDAFSHERTFVNVPSAADVVFANRYPPYTESKRKMMRWITGVKFTRQIGLLAWLFALFRASRKKY